MDTVFFVLAKLVGATLKVETWLLLLALLVKWAAWRERRTLARGASGLLLLLLAGIGFFPVGDLLLKPLEAAPVTIEEGMRLDGIVVLGGGEDVAASMASGQALLGEGGDRHVAALALAHRYPEARILFAGGSGRLRDVNGATVSEAAIAERIYLAQGIASDRLLFESRSRNTAENARLARSLVSPQPGESWVLITSAFHMQRALQSFDAAGWSDVIAYPTDYRTRALADGLGWNFGRNLGLVNTALREWVGRFAYAATGR